MKTLSNKKGTNMLNKLKKNINIKEVLWQTGIIVSVCLLSGEALAAFDLDNFGKAVFDPTKKFVNDYYPVAIFTTGLGGAFLQRDGDLRERSIGFAKGSVFGGLAVLGTKAMFGI